MTTSAKSEDARMDGGVMSKPWAEKHRREAAARLYELAAAKTRAGDDIAALEIAVAVPEEAMTEADFRTILFDPPGADMGVTEIEREVRRVRALAEGRLVRQSDVRYAVRRGDGETPFVCMSRSEANAYVVSPDRPNWHTYKIVTVRVTRIRRVPS